jgi:hypothetical protein
MAKVPDRKQGMDHSGGTPVASAVQTYTLNIANGAKLTTEAIHLGPFNTLSVEMPAAWTAGDLAVYAVTEENGALSAPAATYLALYDSSDTAVAITTPTVSRQYTFVGDMAAAISGCNYIRLRSSVNQGAARVLKVTVKG